MITRYYPKDWKSLQSEAGEILSQCGFNVEVEKTVETVRGNVELDVFAEEIIKGRKYTIACECKYWKSKIPQSIIHGFRTVLNDLGCNKGYIISLEGYQSGAFSAAESTNIELLTWEQFQNQFCASWLENYFSPKLTQQLDPLLGYTEPLVQKWMCQVPDEEIEKIKYLREKYLYFGILIMSFTTYSTYFQKNVFPSLPIAQCEKFTTELKEKLPASILNITGYKEFFDVALEYGKIAISEFQEIKTRNNV